MLGKLPDSSHFKLEKTPPTQSGVLYFNQKLGHLYEDALAELLEQSSLHELLAKNMQLITPKKQTIGELDFILLDKKLKKIVHLEFAVKFYLIIEQDGELLYPGPDARDNFQRKLNRLITHQLTLTKREEAQELLTSFSHEGPITVNHLVHGIFFDHLHAKISPLPSYVSPTVRRRKWLHCFELRDLYPTIKTLRVIPKQLWLCEITPELFEALEEVQITDLIELAQQRCTLCIGHLSSSPYFVAPDNWPNQQ